MNCLILYIYYIITKKKEISIIRKQFNGVIREQHAKQDIRSE